VPGIVDVDVHVHVHVDVDVHVWACPESVDTGFHAARSYSIGLT
jgi:hypothetical protein